MNFLKSTLMSITAMSTMLILPNTSNAENNKPRARDIGLQIGTIAPGKYNAITDVAGVKVGHYTVNIGDDIRTGVTAIIPSDHDMYKYPVPAWIHVGNGYGKLIGEKLFDESGEELELSIDDIES